MFRFKIHYNGEYRDSFVISGTSVDKIRDQIYVECKRRCWKLEHCWIEEIDTKEKLDGLVSKITVIDETLKPNPRTNFDRINSSVESLAEFIYKVRFNCASIGVGCDYCPLKELRSCTLTNIKEWLQKEAK